MLYLIKSSGFKEDKEGNPSYFQLLKIGYTEDSKKDNRFMSYKLHNPTCIVLYEIPDGTEEDEKNIQYKFKDFLFPDYGREWFEYSEEIINFFRDANLEMIKSLPTSPSLIHTKKKGMNRLRASIRKVLEAIYSYIREEQGISPRESFEDQILKDIEDALTVGKVTNESELLEYLSKSKKDQVDRYIKLQERLRNNKEVIDFLDSFNKIHKFKDRLKFLCESNLPDVAINIVLEQIGERDNIRSYYISLGPQRLRALGYDRYHIEKELGVVTFSWELLRDSIYFEFKEGDKLSLVNIKGRLDLLYKSINYNAAPKASDLEKWFEVKKCKITFEVDGTKKRVRGYLLLRSKENELKEMTTQ